MSIDPIRKKALRAAAAALTLLLLPILARPAAAGEGDARIQWFRALPSTVKAGTSTTLYWHVDGVDTVDHPADPGRSARDRLGACHAGHHYYLCAHCGHRHHRDARAHRPPSGRTPPWPAAASYAWSRPPADSVSPRAATLRVFAAAYDPTGGGGNERNAARVDFYVDDQLLGTVPAAESEYWVFKTRLPGIAAGRHRVWVRATYANPAGTLDSESMWIDVDPAPAYGQTVSLAQDVVLSGSQSYELIGTPGARVRLNGNGHRIRTQGTWTGQLRFDHVDVHDLGAPDVPTPAIDIDVRNAITITDSVFDTTGTVALDFTGAAQATIRDNDFRSNMSMPASQQPEFEPQASYPAFRVRGNSSALKFFQGNRIGVGWADFANTSHWLIGGDREDEANIIIAPRGGLWVQNSSEVEVRGNFIYHIYFGGWSQGNVMELGGSDDIVVEHNVVGGGSWPIRGLGGTLRYNLVLDAGHEWLWITGDGATVHHNVFVGGDGDVAPIRMIYGPQDVLFYNNTLDGLSAASMNRPIWVDEDASAELHSNAIVGMPRPSAVRIDGELEADYNLFHGQIGASLQNYSDNRWPAHDVGVLNAQTQPRFAENAEPFRYVWDDLWTREVGVRQVLANYRSRYTPGTNSPLTDAGMPASVAPDALFSSGFEEGEGNGGGANGNDIGAVGSGEAAEDDLFGR